MRSLRIQQKLLHYLFVGRIVAAALISCRLRLNPSSERPRVYAIRTLKRGNLTPGHVQSYLTCDSSIASMSASLYSATGF